MGCSNGLGPGIANLEDVLTDNDNDSCNALTPASLHRHQQQIYQSTFTNTTSLTSHNNYHSGSRNGGGGHAHFNQTNSSLSPSPVLQHLMQPYNSSPVATNTSVESIATTVPSNQPLLPTVSSSASPHSQQTTFIPKIPNAKVDQHSISNLVEQQQQQKKQNNSYNLNGFAINGIISNKSNTIGRKKIPTSSASNGNLCESLGTKPTTNAKGHHTLSRLSVNNRQREELFLC